MLQQYTVCRKLDGRPTYMYMYYFYMTIRHIQYNEAKGGAKGTRQYCWKYYDVFIWLLAYLPEDEVFLDNVLHTCILPHISVKHLGSKLLAVLDVHKQPFLLLTPDMPGLWKPNMHREEGHNSSQC